MSEPLKDEDDFTHYFNATGRLSRENAALRATIANKANTAQHHLAQMHAGDSELYLRILDTPTFAYHFNELCRLAASAVPNAAPRSE